MPFFTLLFAGLLMSPPALAWNATKDFNDGFYWEQLPVAMTVMDANASRLQLIKRLADEAVEEWESTLPTDLWGMSAIQGAPSSSRNVVRWSNRFGAETGLDESTILAVAIRYTHGPYIARAEIILNGNNAINQFEDNLRTVIIHELGHTLGLDHSNVPGAVMAANLTSNYQGLTHDDQAGMEAVVDETLRRQAVGYVSPLSRDSGSSESSSPLSCGTVDISGGPGGGNGPGGSLIFSLGLGMLAALLAFRPARR